MRTCFRNSSGSVDVNEQNGQSVNRAAIDFNVSLIVDFSFVSVLFVGSREFSFFSPFRTTNNNDNVSFQKEINCYRSELSMLDVHQRDVS